MVLRYRLSDYPYSGRLVATSYLTEELLQVVIVHLWWPGRRLMHQALDVAFNVPYLKSSINCSTLVRRTDLAASKNVAGSFDKELVSRCRTISASLLIGTYLSQSKPPTHRGAG